MLVRPDDKVEELWDHALCDGIPATHTQVHSFVLVLMKDKDVEPFVFFLQRALESDLAVFEGHIQSLILHVTDSVESHLGAAFAKEDGHDLDLFDIRHFAEVIDVVVLAHQINIAEVLKSAWVIVIAVNHENGHSHTQILIHIVSVRVLIRFELDVLLAENCVVEQLLALPERLTTWLVFVEEVAAHQQEVKVGGAAGDVQGLLKAIEAIIGAHFIILLIAEMVVRGDHDVEDLALVDHLSLTARLIRANDPVVINFSLGCWSLC